MHPLRLILLLILPLSLLAGSRDDTRSALRVLRPMLAEPRDYTLAPDGSIATWTAPARFTQPTTQELATAVAAVQSAAAAKALIQSRRATLRTAYESLPVNTRAALLNEWSAVNLALDRGDIGAAKARVLAVTYPAGIELTPEQFAAAKAQMLALFP